MNNKPTVNLWRMVGIGLIIPYPTGVMYSNQVGGYGIDHPKLEGVFVPINRGHGIVDQSFNLAKELYDHFTGPKWQGHCSNGINEETANFIDDLLARHNLANPIKVNRNRLPLCQEAWIEVLVEYRKGFSDLFNGTSSEEAILTWPNSD
jgi:hypothetical protein